MNRRITGLLLAALAFSAALPVHAETRYGNPDWSVTFTEGHKMESNFKTADINDEVSSMQPGDNVILTIKLKNEDRNATDWYMKNAVLESLETNSIANGGAYTYRLTYTGPGPDETVLYDSEKVGGTDDDANSRAAAREGLKEATGSLEDYFIVDTLSRRQSGTITLEIGLDGETQGNAYQDTLADLTMQFAVERRPSPVDTRIEPTERRIVNPNSIQELNSVQTSDDSQLVLYIVLLLTSGTALLLLALYCRKVRKKEEE